MDAHEQCLYELQEAKLNLDREDAHIDADGALCDFLEALGYSDVVDIWRKIPKWFS